MKVKEHMVVSVIYEVRNSNGEFVDGNKGFAPLSYIHGLGYLIKGLEMGLEGMQAGETKVISIPPALGYGEYNPDLTRVLDAGTYKCAGQTGDVILLPDGMEAIISAKNSNTLTVDMNHPLAGCQLHCCVIVTEVRMASPEEMAYGQPMLHLRYCSGK